MEVNVPFEEVIEKYNIVVKGRRGKQLKAICPLHEDKDPSLSINTEKGVWWCFSCSRGGDVIKFVMEIEKVDFKEALKILGVDQVSQKYLKAPRTWEGCDAIVDILKDAPHYQAKGADVGDLLFGFETIKPTLEKLPNSILSLVSPLIQEKLGISKKLLFEEFEKDVWVSFFDDLKLVAYNNTDPMNYELYIKGQKIFFPSPKSLFSFNNFELKYFQLFKTLPLQMKPLQWKKGIVMLAERMEGQIMPDETRAEVIIQEGLQDFAGEAEIFEEKEFEKWEGSFYAILEKDGELYTHLDKITNFLRSKKIEGSRKDIVVAARNQGFEQAKPYISGKQVRLWRLK